MIAELTTRFNITQLKSTPLPANILIVKLKKEEPINPERRKIFQQMLVCIGYFCVFVPYGIFFRQQQ